MVKCLTCGTDLGPAETYCPKCGTPKGKALTTDDRQKRMAEEALTYLRSLTEGRKPEEYADAYALSKRYLIAKYPDTPERQKASEEAAETYMATRLKETVMGPEAPALEEPSPTPKEEGVKISEEEMRARLKTADILWLTDMLEEEKKGIQQYESLLQRTTWGTSVVKSILEDEKKHVMWLQDLISGLRASK